jgi:hypothetical protein
MAPTTIIDLRSFICSLLGKILSWLKKAGPQQASNPERFSRVLTVFQWNEIELKNL